jgi:hypothetical protein
MTPIAATTATCTCEKPVPVERAVRKGVAVTVCARCGLAVALKLAAR